MANAGKQWHEQKNLKIKQKRMSKTEYIVVSVIVKFDLPPNNTTMVFSMVIKKCSLLLTFGFLFIHSLHGNITIYLDETKGNAATIQTMM